MSRHQLYEVDLERKTAFCTKCRGVVEIVLRETRKGRPYRPMCVNKANEIKECHSQMLALNREARRLVHPRHVLSDIDPEARTAVCSICGPTDIWIYQRPNKEKPYFACGAHSREVVLRHARPRNKNQRIDPHTLSNIDEAAQTAVCAVCGPVKIEIRRLNKHITRRCVNSQKTRMDKTRR